MPYIGFGLQRGRAEVSAVTPAHFQEKIEAPRLGPASLPRKRQIEPESNTLKHLENTTLLRKNSNFISGNKFY